MKIDWKLKGFNLLKFVCGKNIVLHPETCSDMVLMDHDEDLTLKNWITNDGSTTLGDSLGDWLAANYADATIPYAGNDTVDALNNITHNAGIVYPGEGLTVADSEGGLTLSTATSSTIGGIKLGYTASDNNVPVQVDASGNAYVTCVNTTTTNYLYGWYSGVSTWESTDLLPVIYKPTSDNFTSIDIYQYLTIIEHIFAQTIDPYKIYPIRADSKGHMYAFVPWTDTTYASYAGSAAGLVPASPTSGTTTKYLRADGTWVVPTNTTYSEFTTSTSGLVPAPSTVSSKYLKDNGTWDTPTNTTYSGDNTTIAIDENNVISSLQNINIITDTAADFSWDNSYKHSTYKTVGEQTSADLTTSLENIFSTIEGLDLSTSSSMSLNYQFEIPSSIGTISCILDNTDFVTKYAAGTIKLCVYGDLEFVADNNTLESVTTLTFMLGTASTDTFNDIIVNVVTGNNTAYVTFTVKKLALIDPFN